MRLINTRTYEEKGILAFEEFFEVNVPSYAILSHRWGSEELTYKEVVKQPKKEIDKCREGYRKAISACIKTNSYGVKYLWCDTCCISKDSSAELTEAINSMFKWYRESRLCLVYLADVGNERFPIEAFRNSEWFTRAWTLQELLAPKQVYFYNCHWENCGDKHSRSVIIESITRIPSELLKNVHKLSNYHNAQKMSWAAKRKATRTEDIAYSLLGIFGVNMVPLYGEGNKAFMRLQEELIRHSKDPTFLQWKSDDAKRLEGPTCRLFARNPGEFAHIQALFYHPSHRSVPKPTRLNLTNLELDVEASLVRWAPETYALVLSETPFPGSSCTAILLRKSGTSSTMMYRSDIREWKQNADFPYPQIHRKITIASEMSDSEGYQLERVSSRFGFNIFCEPNVHALSLGTKYGIPPVALSSPRVLEEVDGPIECVFDDPEQPAFARMAFLTLSTTDSVLT